MEWMFWLVGTIAVIAGYFAIGIAKARSRSVELYRAAKAKAFKEWRIMGDDSVERNATRDYREAMNKWVWLWPFMPVVAWFRSLYTTPLDKVRAEAAEARASAKTWDEVERTAKTDREREMARELAKMLRDQAKSLDL